MAISYEQRWAEVRLILHRPIGGLMAYAIVERRSQGTAPRDRMLCHGMVPCHPGTSPSADALAALELALAAAIAREQRSPSA